jgi:hypothetical protein
VCVCVCVCVCVWGGWVGAFAYRSRSQIEQKIVAGVRTTCSSDSQERTGVERIVRNCQIPAAIANVRPHLERLRASRHPTIAPGTAHRASGQVNARFYLGISTNLNRSCHHANFTEYVENHQPHIFQSNIHFESSSPGQLACFKKGV